MYSDDDARRRAPISHVKPRPRPSPDESAARIQCMRFARGRSR